MSTTSNIYYIKRGDTKRSIQATLTDCDGVVVDLTAASSVKFIMKQSTASGTPKVSAPATIVTPGSGVVRYDWAGTDTDTTGKYHAEWEVTWPGPKLDTYPSDGYNQIVIAQDLNP